MPDPDRVHIFEQWSTHYDASVRSETGPHEGYEEVLRLVVHAAEATGGMRILDLGVGTGNLAQRFLALGCEVWGTDFSPAMLAQARAKLPQLRLIQMNLLDDPWPGVLTGERFDRVVSTYVFHEFPLATKVSLLRGVASDHLVAGGWIAIGDVAFPNRQALEEADAHHWDEDEHYWEADEAIAACAAAGLVAAYTQVSRCGGILAIRPAS